jgi:hypothetical protein
MGWPLNLSVLAPGAAFLQGLTHLAIWQRNGALEKSAALYQKDLDATTAIYAQRLLRGLPNPGPALVGGLQGREPLVAIIFKIA